MPHEVIPSKELLHKLLNAQARELASNVEGPAEVEFWSDDTCDYVESALDAFTVVFRLYRGYYEDIGDEALELLGKWLNTPPDQSTVLTSSLGYTLEPLYDGSGLAAEFYELDCPALPKDEGE